MKTNRFQTILMAGCACAALGACGADDIASPGTGGNVIINPGTPAPSPTPTPTPAEITAAASCPAIGDPKGLTDSGTVSAANGDSWRVCTLPSIISRSTVLPKVAGLLYRINGRVDVGCDGGFFDPASGSFATPVTSTTVGCTAANGFNLNGSGQLTTDTNVTLTIQPGVVLFGETGTSWLAVNRGNKLLAEGTASAPIVFTSRSNIAGTATDATNAQWGGVVLMGRAPVTGCTAGGSTAATVAANTCERQTEGAVDPANFGGRNEAYNAGSLKYVQIRYSGYVLSANSELQGLTGEGVGSGTTLDYIQSHNSSDDGAEFFGGTVRMKHYIATGADDDSIDIDNGIQGRFQYVLLIQRPGQGDALMEVDSDGLETELPRQKSIIANFTALQPQVSSNNEANDRASILNRGNSDLTLVNGLVVTPNNECVRVNGSGSTADRATLTARSVLMQCNATKYLATGTTGIAYTAAEVAAFFSGNGNNDAYTSSLTSLFINGANENTGVTAFDAKTLDSWFDTTTYVGAVKDSTDSWYAGWTCNSGYAPFDNASVARRGCTSVPL
jgi:hypothetical protein